MREIPRRYDDGGMVAKDMKNNGARRINMDRHRYWRGVRVIKLPTDLLLYHEAIWEKRPDYVVEIGTYMGGSALFFQDMLDIRDDGGKVITLDIKDEVQNKDPRITYLTGDSIDDEMVAKVKTLVSGKVMLVVDGNHHRRHVKWELHKYSPMVTKGQYIVMEDCYSHRGLHGPGQARDWFLATTRGFKNKAPGAHRFFQKTNRSRRYLVGMTMGGWLQRT